MRTALAALGFVSPQSAVSDSEKLMHPPLTEVYARPLGLDLSVRQQHLSRAQAAAGVCSNSRTAPVARYCPVPSLCRAQAGKWNRTLSVDRGSSSSGSMMAFVTAYRIKGKCAVVLP